MPFQQSRRRAGYCPPGHQQRKEDKYQSNSFAMRDGQTDNRAEQPGMSVLTG
jgi:hypothetical protein